MPATFSDIVNQCPNAWQGDFGFRNWMQMLYGAGVAGTTPDWPVVSSVAPNTAVHPAGATAITVTGTGYVNGSVITVSGTPLTTTFTSSTSLGATIPAPNLVTAGTLSIGVNNPDGMKTATTVTFTVT